MDGVGRSLVPTLYGYTHMRVRYVTSHYYTRVTAVVYGGHQKYYTTDAVTRTDSAGQKLCEEEEGLKASSSSTPSTWRRRRRRQRKSERTSESTICIRSRLALQGDPSHRVCVCALGLSTYPVSGLYSSMD